MTVNSSFHDGDRSCHCSPIIIVMFKALEERDHLLALVVCFLLTGGNIGGNLLTPLTNSMVLSFARVNLSY